MPTVTTSSARTRERFHWRAFVSLLVVAGFVVLGMTGIGLYLTPAGRIANWSGWTLGGLTKAQWQAVHMVFGFLFVVAGAFHRCFNWRALLSYLRSHVSTGLRRKREIAWSLAVILALVASSLADLPPVSEVAAVRERVANSWSNPTTEPPAPHTELLTLAQIAEARHLPIDQALALFSSGRVALTPDMTLAAAADTMGLTPRDLFQPLGTRAADAGPLPVTGSGPGWKTLRAVSTEMGLPIETAVTRLAEAGITAEPDSTLRDIASRRNRHAPEIVALLAAPVR